MSTRNVRGTLERITKDEARLLSAYRKAKAANEEPSALPSKLHEHGLIGRSVAASLLGLSLAEFEREMDSGRVVGTPEGDFPLSELRREAERMQQARIDSFKHRVDAVLWRMLGSPPWPLALPGSGPRTLPQAAKELGCGRRHVSRLVRDGVLFARRNRKGQVVVTPEELSAYQRAQKASA